MAVFVKSEAEAVRLGLLRPRANAAGAAPKARGGNRGAAGGKRADLGGLYLRSKWEANIARYLNWLVAHGEIARWEYEADEYQFHTVKRGRRFYKPDFKVWTTETAFEYWEVKGWMNRTSATALKRMARHHPGVKIVLIDEPRYAAIASAARRLVPGWE